MDAHQLLDLTTRSRIVLSRRILLVVASLIPIILLGLAAFLLWSFIVFETDRLTQPSGGREKIPALHRKEMEEFVKRFSSPPAPVIPPAPASPAGRPAPASSPAIVPAP